MALEADGRRGFVVGLGHRQPLNWPFELRYGREEAKRLARAATVTGTITTPWRVVMLGRDLNALVNSDILPNLCPPADPRLFPQGMATPWVEPASRSGATSTAATRASRADGHSRSWAAKLGAKYHIVEGIWRRFTDEQVRKFVDYSRELGVRLLFWRHSRQLRTPEEREAFFELLRDWGSPGRRSTSSTTRPRRASTSTRTCCVEPRRSAWS